MDETLRELVSRRLDGDLDDADAARLDERARTDAELAAEIDSGRTLREAVAELADRMEPPATLDRVMDPLLRSAPVPAQRVRPVYRWLGAAAVVVLGVTVAVDVARRNPEPTLSRPSLQRERPAREREEIFELAPLPTANPDESHPLGATDRLLEEEPVPPAAPEPAPLEVMGPLSTDESAAAADEAPRSSGNEPAPDGEVVETTVLHSRPAPAKKTARAHSGTLAGTASTAPQEAGLSQADKDREETFRAPDAGKAYRDKADGGRQAPVAPVVLHIDGLEVWSGSTGACAVGVWPVRIEVRDGEVVSWEPILGETGDETGERGEGCQPETLIGSIVADVGDGIHLAEIVVGERSP